MFLGGIEEASGMRRVNKWILALTHKVSYTLLLATDL